MQRRTAIKRMGGGLAAIFLSACADGTKLLDPLAGGTADGTGGSRLGARKSEAIVPHEIYVTVGDASISVWPETLRMSTRNRVRFNTTNGRGFSIIFDGTGPFADRELAFETAKTYLSPIRKGRFKYTIVSTEDPSVMLDPEVIVGDPPSTPKP